MAQFIIFHNMDTQSSINMEISEPARELHKKAVIIDGHNDSLSRHWLRKESMDLGKDWPAYHVDLRRMRAGGLTALNSMAGYKNLVESLELWDGMRRPLVPVVPSYAETPIVTQLMLENVPFGGAKLRYERNLNILYHDLPEMLRTRLQRCSTAGR